MNKRTFTKKAPYKGFGADSEEKHEPVSDNIDTIAVDSLKALDPNQSGRARGFLIGYIKTSSTVRWHFCGTQVCGRRH
jgi:hypothetical protein